MQCQRCGTTSKRKDIVCAGCGLRLRFLAKVPGAVCSGGLYVTRRHAHVSPLRVRAKPGFPVPSGVPPTPPVQTASAASPIRGHSRARPPVERKLRPRAAPPPVRPAPIPQARAEPPKPPPPARPAPMPEPPRVAKSAPRAPAPAIRAKASRVPVRPAAKPVRRPPVRSSEVKTPGATLISSIVMAGMALGVGGAWWTTVQSETGPARPAVSMATPADTHVAAIAQLPAAAAEPQPVAPPAAAAPAASAAEPQTAAVEEAEPAPRQAAPAPSVKSRGAVRVERKRAPVLTKKERNEEIDRLRTQAFSETSKDRLERINRARGPGKSPVSSRAAPRTHAATRLALADCEHRRNFVRRELCKWKVCGGSWGKHGCPSYDDPPQISLN